MNQQDHETKLPEGWRWVRYATSTPALATLEPNQKSPSGM